MPSNLRRRKGSNEDHLPQSVNNPKPDPNPTGHVASNRQESTITPTVFIVLIVGLMFSLLPIFYYTQVMIPDPQSTSILSQFRIKGNILLSTLGHHHTTSQSDHHPSRTTSSEGSVDQPQPVVVTTDPKTGDQLESTDPTHRTASSSASTATIHSGSKLASHEVGETPPFDMKDTPRTTDGRTISKDAQDHSGSIQADSKSQDEEQAKIDEELGLFWEASSRYRREAQRDKSGQYSIKGDGMSGSDEETESLTSLDDLPEADPDAQAGLTPEFWDAIKDQFSADDLTVLLNEMRSKEQATTSTHSTPTPA